MTIHQFHVGMELPELHIEPISRKTLALFAGASGDHQPSHIDIDAACAKGRDDVIAHGMLMMAYLGRLVTDLVPQQRLLSSKSRFVATTPVHSEPICKARIIAMENGTGTLELNVVLKDGLTVVRGEAIIRA
ncbi:MAG: MaoC/PaaZ C-terminal domain-containing protein [Phyllobacterium sp.]|uniref:MaoC/PaaZ C-terminal domain-containing protein n=1 Tax=Phyllobacterium sp. TaxID=1871046 RepID=UPI0030EFC0D9